jgi:hypothetical protein
LRPGLIPTGRRHAPRREWTDGAFPVLGPRGFYSTSGACSVSPFATMVSGEGSARRQPEVRFDSEGLRSRQKRMGKAASRSLAGGRRPGARGSTNESRGALLGGREVNEPQYFYRNSAPYLEPNGKCTRSRRLNRPKASRGGAEVAKAQLPAEARSWGHARRRASPAGSLNRPKRSRRMIRAKGRLLGGTLGRRVDANGPYPMIDGHAGAAPR